MNKDIEIIEKQRQSVKEFMLKHKLNAFSWAKKAGISEATIRHYLSGRNRSLTCVNIERLANAVGSTAQDIIGDSPSAETVSLSKTNDSFEIQRDLFVQVFLDLEMFISKNNINSSPRVKANILLAWYQLTELLQKTGEKESSPELFQELFYKIAAEG